ncbi:MAG: phenylalanine--tRNA ligase subunit beta [Proteobacteria bacterium]|nr:phenylalanine--tRNA ligase subunit beta [Pseudomonadota bacterium]|tara:strand:+ start:380 stop:2740 length:2361 start_codon:yes stop_codon:yes gene_type:complete
MIFSESWLRDLCNPPISSADLAQCLTMAGLEVEDVSPVCESFSGVIVGLITRKEKHPNAERLNLCQVDVGKNKLLAIICGAPNVSVGMKVACALPGAKLPKITIKPATIRGVDSAGMLCSKSELGLTEESDGIWELPAEAPVGDEVRDYFDLDDKIFSLKLTPNRGDCLSIHGIAREVAAITNSKVSFENTSAVKPAIVDRMSIEIVDKEACPKYAGRIISQVNPNVKTPEYIVQRLLRSGIRSINAVVDLTNYVMLEVGQPMHAFDLDKLNGGIVVRFATKGEVVKLLNGQDLELDSDMLTINDSKGPVALAGIMGGLNSSVTETTENLFLESAFFAADVVAGKWRQLGFSTDALHRYERGVDPNLAQSALDRLSNLIAEVCGGNCGPVSVDQGSLPNRKSVDLRVAKCEKVLGFKMGSVRIADVFQRLNLPAQYNNGVFSVTPPSYRFDLEIEEDLIEEVARVDGYDKLPAISPNEGLRFVPINKKITVEKILRDHFVRREYLETVTFSFVDDQLENDFGDLSSERIVLKNPISVHLNVMRTSLIGSLINSLKFNVNRYQNRVRLFEISRVFNSNKTKIRQPYCCAGIAYGGVLGNQWGRDEKNVDFFDVKADLESLLPKNEVTFTRSSRNGVHPGRAADIIFNKKNVGWVGELHPKVLSKYEIASSVVAFEFQIEGLFDLKTTVFQKVSKFPAVVRDLAIVVEEKQAAGEILTFLNRLEVNKVERVDLFDVYSGKGIDKGQKGLAFRVLLQDTDKTLSDDEIDEVIGELLEELTRTFSAKPRR